MFLSAVDLFLVSLGLIYFVVMMGAGFRVLKAAKSGTHRRPQPSSHRAPERGAVAGLSPSALAAYAARARRPVVALYRRVHAGITTPDGPVARATVVVDAADCVVYFLVPCLNEAAVIPDTVRELLADCRAKVVVVDDASSDDTGKLALAVDPARVMVVRRELPAARQGKGPALNAGYAEVLCDSASRGIAPSRVIVCVMDADGRLSAKVLDAVLPLFANDHVGGVQLPVRIRNRHSLLTRMQDVEFWGSSAVAQLGRTKFGTVSLGGNGQFTRLSALLGLGRDPWQASLTEDLDLALALLAAGWRLTSTPDAHVSQQGITTLKALLRQRTRWFQGHMLCSRWIPELWRSRGLSHLGLLEVTMYLLAPWLLVLPWSIVFHYSMFMIAEAYIFGGSQALGATSTELVVTIGLWYVLSFMPCWLSGYLYYRQNRRSGLLRSLALGHLLLAANYVTYVACWRALFHILMGRASWDKTARYTERRARRATAAVSGWETATQATRAATPAIAGSDAAVATTPLAKHLVPAPRQPASDRSSVPILVRSAAPAGPPTPRSAGAGLVSVARANAAGAEPGSSGQVELGRAGGHRGRRSGPLRQLRHESAGIGSHRAPARRP
jgi:1,2-diacylglycerol 3-beta-glucosyltransferase